MKLKHEPAKSNPVKRPDPAAVAAVLANYQRLVPTKYDKAAEAAMTIADISGDLFDDLLGTTPSRKTYNLETAVRRATELLNAVAWLLFHLDALSATEAPPALMGLTPPQIDCLYAIHKWFAKEKRFAPSFADLQKAMGYSSPSAVGRLLHKIEEQGYITMNGGSRSIALTDKGMKYKPQGD